MTDRSSYQQNRFRWGSPRGEGRSPVERNLSVIIVQIAAPLRTLRAPLAHSHLLRGPAHLVQLPKPQFLTPTPEKMTFILAFRLGFWARMG
jgi:hypothetical protein